MLSLRIFMLLERHHFHFFGANREMTSLYFTLALLYFAEGLISVFVPIYFWKLGMPLWQILFFYFLNSLYFLILLFLFIPVLKKLSDKMLMFLSLPFLILYYFGLGALENFPNLFYLLPIGLAGNMLFFNTGYHVDFLGASEKGHLGREIGLRHMVASLTQFASPFVGGVLIFTFGFGPTFYIGALLLLLAVLPLFFFPKRSLSPTLSREAVWNYLKLNQLMPFTFSGIGFAAEKMVSVILWPLFMYFALKNIEDFGGIVSVGLLAGAIVTYLIGFLADHGKRRRMIYYSAPVLAVLWFSRPFFGGALSIVGSHIAMQIIYSALIVAWSSQYYKIASSSPDPGSFILSREALYHAARVPFMAVFVLMAFLMPQGALFASGFVAAGIFTLFFLFANRMPRHEDIFRAIT